MFSMASFLLGMSCLNAASQNVDRFVRQHCQNLQRLIANADVRACLLRHKRVVALVFCVCALMLWKLGPLLWFVVSGGGSNSTSVG